MAGVPTYSSNPTDITSHNLSYASYVVRVILHKTNEIEKDSPSASTLAALLEREGFRSPDLFVQRIDPLAKTALILRMNRQAYRATSFLDDRLLAHTPDGFVMPHDHLVRWVQAITAPPQPIHFIFHAGHVGSTLLSRLIEEAAGVLALREPPTLRTLATVHDTLSHPNPVLSIAQLETWVAIQVRLWRRGYDDTRCVVVKATSDTARIGQTLMQVVPEAKAILLNVTAEQYVATSLSAPSLAELHGKANERAVRLSRMLGENETARSNGETAAMSWLTERLTQDRLSHPWPARTLRVDFDDFLAEPALHLKTVFYHLGLEAPAALIQDTAAHPLMLRYSKNPDRAYSIAERTQRLQQSRRDNAEEVRKGLAWLDRVARAHPRAATALAA